MNRTSELLGTYTFIYIYIYVQKPDTYSCYLLLPFIQIGDTRCRLRSIEAILYLQLHLLNILNYVLLQYKLYH